jgi:cytochrome P450
MVIGNLYAAHRDPKYFPNPEEFKPDRFLEYSAGDRDHPKFKRNPGFLAFGCG